MVATCRRLKISIGDYLGSVRAAITVLPSDARLIGTVHDELIFDCPSNQAAQYASIIRMVMEDAFKELFGPDLPIEVEAKPCKNWGEK